MEMKSFEKVWKHTNTVGSVASFDHAAARLLYKCLIRVPKKGTVLEIGCQYGRSTSVIMQVAKEIGFDVILVDPFNQDNRAMSPCLSMLQEMNHPFTLHYRSSQELEVWPKEIDLIHLDGDHEAEPLTKDLHRSTKYLLNGGFLCCHDYGRESLPAIRLTVDRFLSEQKALMKGGEWVEIGVAGTLGVWKWLLL
jgi:cephalosporin hydroxylase